MAFLTTPKHGGWLIAGAVLIVLGMIGMSLVPHRYRCRHCGRLMSADEFEAHLHRAHHNE